MAKEKELGRGTYRAEQVPGAVVLHATGMTPTPNYTVSLEKSMISVFPPEYLLFFLPPEGMQMQVLEPFAVEAVIQPGTGFDHVIVRDEDGEHIVPVGNAAE